MKLKVLEVSSDPLERGLQIGETNSKLINEFINLLYEDYREKTGEYFEMNNLRDFLGECMQASKEFAPDLYVELKGIARAANVKLDDIIFINSFLELINFRFPETCTDIFGCTSLGVSDDLRVKGNVYIGQNFDMEAYYKDYATLIKIKGKEDQGDTFLITFAGILGCMGFSSDGIGVNINYLQANDLRSGILFPFIIRKILQQKRIGDAIGAATSGFKASGMNYLISDSLGNTFNIETSSTEFDIIPMRNGAIWHSNHYKSDFLRKKDMMVYDISLKSPISRRGSTIIRDHICERLLTINGGNIEIEDIKNILKDHTNYPFSICKHGNSGREDKKSNKTVLSSIFDLKRKEAHLALGCPCTSEYSIYKL